MVEAISAGVPQVVSKSEKEFVGVIIRQGTAD
jgi:hypothetical protein